MEGRELKYKKPAGRGRVGDEGLQLLPHAVGAGVIIMLEMMELRTMK
jgi:hypothetical protein